MKLLIAIGLGLAGLALAGCPSTGTSGKTATTGTTTSRPPIDAADLKPDALPYASGLLVMGGTELAVKVEKKQVSEREFKLISSLAQSGTKLEEETYLLDKTTFQYVGTNVESFDPPLTIANLPFTVPSNWEWTGKYVWDQQNGPMKAKATITAEPSPLNLPGGQFDDAILSLVKLTIEEPNGNTADLELKFWLAPGRGVIQREIAASSTRQPAPQQTEP